MVSKTKLKKLNYSDDDIEFFIRYCKKHGDDAFLIEVIGIEKYAEYLKLNNKPSRNDQADVHA